MALCSAYSLAAINQVYNLSFEWYSQYYGKYTSQYRDISNYEWNLPEYPENMKFGIIDEKYAAGLNKSNSDVDSEGVSKSEFDKYISVYCTLGECDSPQYGIKFTEVAQRGGVVEVRVNLNGPAKPKDKSDVKTSGRSEPLKTGHVYYPRDMIRIDRNAFPVKGELLFIFKNQDGKQLYQMQFNVN